MWKTGLALVVMASSVQAADCTGAAVRFVESAPRDRFELVVGTQALRAVSIDLRGSAGKLIFDTESGGTGVEVFQQLRDEGGTSVDAIADGAEVIKVGLKKASVGSRAAFSIDVDDRLTASDLGQIRVTGGEMAGAIATFETTNGDLIRAVFDGKNRAIACP